MDMNSELVTRGVPASIASGGFRLEAQNVVLLGPSGTQDVALASGWTVVDTLASRQQLDYGVSAERQ